jgi:hypothetical protein
MENLDYVYIQISEDVHNDRPRLLIQSSNGSTHTIYISDIKDIIDVNGFLNQIINYLNSK